MSSQFFSMPRGRDGPVLQHATVATALCHDPCWCCGVAHATCAGGKRGGDGKRKGAISKREREAAAAAHQASVLCLVARCLALDAAADDPTVQVRAASAKQRRRRPCLCSAGPVPP